MIFITFYFIDIFNNKNLLSKVLEEKNSVASFMHVGPDLRKCGEIKEF